MFGQTTRLETSPYRKSINHVFWLRISWCLKDQLLPVHLCLNIITLHKQYCNFIRYCSLCCLLTRWCCLYYNLVDLVHSQTAHCWWLRTRTALPRTLISSHDRSVFTTGACGCNDYTPTGVQQQLNTHRYDTGLCHSLIINKQTFWLSKGLINTMSSIHAIFTNRVMKSSISYQHWCRYLTQ